MRIKALGNGAVCIYNVSLTLGMTRMQGTVRKWGNSAAVRIPATVLEAARLHLDQPVTVREEDGRVIIEPMHQTRFDIEALVADITDENRHDPEETGPPLGQEVW